MREQFANQVLQNQEVDPMFVRKILFIDEAHFHIDGFINKQNWRIWAARNPQTTKAGAPARNYSGRVSTVKKGHLLEIGYNSVHVYMYSMGVTRIWLRGGGLKC